MRLRNIARATLASGLACAVGAGADPLPKNGDIVFLKVSTSLLRRDTHISGWSWSDVTYDANIAAAGPDVSVNGKVDWRVSAFPSLVPLEVKKVGYNTEKHRAEIQLESDRRTKIRLFIAGEKADSGRLFGAVTATREEKSQYLTDTYALLVDRFLAEGPVAAVPIDKRLALVRAAHAANATRLGVADYKGSLHLVLQFGTWDTVYNELRMDQSQRVARVLTDSLLAAMKTFAPILSDAEQLGGLKLEVIIPHRPFTRDVGNDLDVVEIYTPTAQLKQFADADVTSQALIDRSVVIVNSNRVEVRLSGS